MKKLKKIVASLLAVLMLLGVAPITALAGEIELHRINTTQQPAEEPVAVGETGFTLTENSRFYIVGATDPTGEDLANFVQLIDSEFAAKGLPNSTVLPIKYGEESLAQAGDIVVKVNGNSEDSLVQQSYTITVEADKITVSGGGVSGAYYGLVKLLRMFEKNKTLSKQVVENSPLVEERSAYIDCGRIYFSPALLKAIIKTLAWNGMNTLYLDFSNNNATRFFLDNMTITVGGASANSAATAEEQLVEEPVVANEKLAEEPVVTNEQQAQEAAEETLAEDNENEEPQEKAAPEADKANNLQFDKQIVEPAAASVTYNVGDAINSISDGRYLTESDMDEIIDVAKQYGVQIIPTFNSPGHIGGLRSLNESLFDKGAATDYDSSCGKVTLDIANEEAYKFGIEVNKLYIDYFASKGCKSYNIAADEATLGNVKYDSNNATFVKYVNELAAYIKSKGMTPRMFNDGIKTTDSDISKDIVILYWAPENKANEFINNGYKVVNFSYGAGLYFAYGASWWVWNQPIKTIYDGWTPGVLNRNTNSQNTYIATETVSAEKLLGATFAVWTDYAFNYNKTGVDVIKENSHDVVEKIQVVGERCWKNSSKDSYSTWKNNLTTAPGGIDVKNYGIDSTVLPKASDITAAVAKFSEEEIRLHHCGIAHSGDVLHPFLAVS